MRMERCRIASDDALNPSSSSSSFNMSDLPEEIQTLILSLLSLKEAARTSIVSRNWRTLWTRHPNLSFDGTRNGSNDDDCVRIEGAEFIETVNSIVQQHSGVGLNSFCIRYGLEKKSSDHLDRWIRFATAGKAKIIDINLWSKKYIGRPRKEVYHFPLGALGDQDGPFIQSLFLTDVSIESKSDICGFTKLRRLLLHSVQIIGDLASLLLNCPSLEDLKLIKCSGLTDLSIPHQLDKLRHLLLSDIQVLIMHAVMQERHPVWGSQVHGYLVHMVTKPTCIFMNLRHLTCEIKIVTDHPNSYSGLLQLASYLEFAPQLETLHLHMFYYTLSDSSWKEEVTGEATSFMRGLDHLKTVYMSGFRGFRAQVELLFGILEKGTAIEHVTLEPQVKLRCARVVNALILEWKINEWARRLSERFGKVITVAPPIRGPLPLS
ncbi:unnamed protein product [Urochloa humidicola]